MAGILPRRLVIGWGLGSLGSSALHNGIAFLALYYLTQVLGMAATLAGTLILAAKVYDIVTDPLVGYLSDRTPGALGRRRPWLLAGAVVSGSAFALLFNPADGHAAALTVSTAAALLLYATGYTLFGVPYLAMPAEMTGDYHERSRLMSARTICLALGILAGGALAPALVGALGGGMDGYRGMGWVMGVLIAVAMAGSFFATAGARHTVAAAHPLPWRSQWATALANRPFLLLIAAKFCHLAGVAVSMTSLLFLVTAVLGRSEASMGSFVVASAAGSIGSMPLWLAVSRRHGKRNTYFAGVLCYLPVLLSWLAATPGESQLLFLVRGLLTGIATGGLTLSAQAMLPDAIEHDYRCSGLRREATFAAVYSVAEKLASAVGPFLLALVLQAAGESGGRLTPGSTGSGTVLLVAAIVPAVTTLASAALLCLYTLDRELRRADG
jgi:GPH family glycoside/pentoside/hexuronide:cation symporter